MGKASRKKRQEAERNGRAVKAAPAPYVARPFAGLPGEADWVALREIVPSATATVALAAGAPGVPDGAPRQVTVCTILPMACPALRRTDGEVFLALQTVNASGDASRDLAQALLAAVASEPGSAVENLPSATADTPRLQDLLDLSVPFEVTVRDDFDFWVAPDADLPADGRASLAEAKEAIIPTRRLSGVDAAYWCRVGERTHIRWLLTYDEDAATNALARLHARGADLLGEGTRLLGAFRAGGLLCPVWDLDPSLDASAYEGPMERLAGDLARALAEDGPLSVEERRAKNGLLSRQLTLR
ncbi:hypothetical protein SAMN05421595_2318 [Austwickia chelonae]|uniref:DUF5926 domain-containing protein n=1 Tax=Austwickia chelonae NBRC 105200 TaxID=1184607 RepID=K6VPK4_9MICO|nr:DUF5926 family protein [Austwickia chelonae]GAB78664.1 hypothetical protein AUCHE_16_00830 [Austwickia chelonae NBRC 105200]SEW34516.1 hypothetical protein SAMN05421595_2318 [Austwickia chelonae]